MPRLLLLASGFALLVAVLASPAAGAPDAVWTACNTQGDDPDTAIKACSRIIGGRGETADNRAYAHGFRGNAYLRKGDYDRAITDLNHHLGRFGNYSGALTERGLAHLAKGDLERALRDFEEAIRLEPKYAKAYAARGDLHRKKEDYDRAIADYDQAIQLDKKYNFVYRDRGLAFESKGDLDKALADFRATVTVSQGSRPHDIFGSSWEAARKDAEEGIQRIEQKLAARLPPKPVAPQPEIKSASPPVELPKVSAPAVPPTPQKKEVAALPVPAPAPVPAPEEIAWKFLKATTDVAALRRFVTEFPNSARKSEAEVRIATLERELRPPVQPANPVVTPIPADTGRRVALVIGNGSYRHATVLPNPANDAADIAQALRELGFEVIEGRDLDWAGMRSKVKEFDLKLDNATMALFFYAGHGVQVEGRNYLVPVDAKLERAGTLDQDAFDVLSVLRPMEAEKRINLVFLDACRDNPFTRSLARSLGASRSSAVGRGLAPIQRASGTLITYATEPGNVAADGEGRNSPFTAALLKHIRKPGIEIEQMMKLVRMDVLVATREKQLPKTNSGLPIEVFLRRAAQ